MGFWRDLFVGPPPSAASILTPLAPQDSIQSLVVADFLGLQAGAAQPLNRETALKIPAVKRAHDVICGVIARTRWEQYAGAERRDPQPAWLTTSSTGQSPRALRWAIASDLFIGGWAVVGFELGDDGQPIDALHIPSGWWKIDPATGEILVNDKIAPRLRQRAIAINLGYGSNGILVDGHDTLEDAIAITRNYRDRTDNPIASTDLEIAADRWDGWTHDEREEFRGLWIAGRTAKNGAVALRPDWVKPNYSGQLPVDLYESGRNANRLDIANHAGLPASILEGVRQGGSGGGTEIRYSGADGGAARNELWDYGIANYADAIEARLSLDDVCIPGDSIRVDASNFLAVPNPTAPQTSQD